MSWEKVKLGDIATCIQPGPFGSQLHQSDYSEFGTPIIMPKDMIDGKISHSNLIFVGEEHTKRLCRHQVHAGNIMVARKGDVRKCVFITENEDGWMTGSDCLKVALKENYCYPRFIYYQLRSSFIGRWLEKISIGATMPSINTGLLSGIELVLPPIKEQKRIADILSAYDNLIENNQKQIKLLEEAAQRLYKQWFIYLRYPGHETTKIVDGIPEGWSWKSILKNDIFKFVSSHVLPFKGEKTYYATADVNGTNIVSSGEKITFDNKPSRAAIQPVLFSVWFARMSNSYKILNCFGENSWMEKSAILSSGFAGFSSKVEFYGFVCQTIASKYFNEEKDRYATGATQVSLTNEGLAKINVLIPSEHVIIQYSKFVEPLMYKAELLKNENFKLKESRDRLLPKLMNGEL